MTRSGMKRAGREDSSPPVRFRLFRRKRKVRRVRLIPALGVTLLAALGIQSSEHAWLIVLAVLAVILAALGYALGYARGRAAMTRERERKRPLGPGPGS